MKKSWLKMVIAFVVAAITGVGYYMWIQPPEGSVAYVATNNIVVGEAIKPNMVRPVRIKANEHIPIIQPEDIIGKTVKHSLQSGEWINPSLLIDEQLGDIRYYTLHLSYVQADGALVREGMQVDVWAQASDTTKPHKVLSNVLVFRVVTQGVNEVAVGEELNVVLAVKEDQISAVEAAKKQSSLFLVVEGDELP
ncbi:MAG TPA: SAF domain-containing protein [Bacillales bacterium]